MSHRYAGSLTFWLLLTISATAAAQWRCDCTTIVDSCAADVSIAADWVEVTTNQQQCARVDYFIDGLPFVAVVVEGRQRQDWIARGPDPDVIVQSCQVCRDNGGNQPPISAPAAAAAETGLEPLIEVTPVYPPTAQTQGLEGYVELSLTVDQHGAVTGAEVTASQPEGVFDQAALAALNRWRYPEALERAPQTVTARFDFSLTDYILDLRPARAPTADALAQSIGGVRNECLRENVVYNYGELIEVGMMNTCQDPLIVFGCAEGTGRNQNLWVCTDSERQHNVLVGPGDGRIGESTLVATPSGTRTHTFTDGFFVARAPNTQYWWLACELADSGCRDSARQWVRGLDRQLARVDPQARTSLPVARSY